MTDDEQIAIAAAAIREAVCANQLDDHALYVMGEDTEVADSLGGRTAIILAKAVIDALKKP